MLHSFTTSPIGAKYVILTSKHHDAYTLWPSKLSPKWNSVEIGPKLDLAKVINDAVRAEGMKMGYYYSLLEWRHPMYGKNNWYKSMVVFYIFVFLS